MNIKWTRVFGWKAVKQIRVQHIRTFFVNFAVFISTNAADTAFTYDLYELNVTRPDPKTQPLNWYVTWLDPEIHREI